MISYDFWLLMFTADDLFPVWIERHRLGMPRDGRDARRKRLGL